MSITTSFEFFSIPSKRCASTIKINLLLQSSQQLGRGLLTVTLRVVLGPEPQILAGLLEGALGGPAKLAGSTVGVGSQVQDITGTAGGNLVREVTTDSSGEGTNHFVDGAALTGTQVPGTDTGVVGAKVVQSLQVTVSQVQNVDVITDGSAVVGVVVYCNVSYVICTGYRRILYKSN